MISVGFKRVSKKRPCRICGKPTYCGFSRDEGTSICMRISAGSRGLSRNGGNIHVHPEIPFITLQPRIKRPLSQSIPLAPLEIRDAVFRESQLIKEIDEALRRIDEGTYGQCVRCGKPIDEERLKAMPTARYDAACQAAIESAQGTETPSL